MSDESMDDLQKVYDDILGPGEELKDDSKKAVDEAYKEEDYTSETLEDGVDDIDPRDENDEEETEEDEEEFESSEDDEDGEEELDDEEDGDEDDIIPDHLVEAGRQAGLSDAEIIRLDADNPAFLESLADSNRSKEQTIVVPDGADKKTDDEKKREALSKLNIDATALELDDNTAQAVTPIQEAVNKMVDRITELEEQLGHTSSGVDELSKSREIEFSNQIDGYFDSKVKEVPSLGLTKSMTTKQAKARTEVWDVAKAIHNGSDGKIGIDAALDTAINAAKGKVGEKQVKDKLVKGLAGQKKRFTSRPRGGRRKSQPKLSEKDRALKAIDRVLDGTE